MSRRSASSAVMSRLFLLISLAVCLPLAMARPQWRVINGTEPRLFEFPAMVSVWYRNMHYCGGTLIDDDTVLTAAHCFYRVTNPKGDGMYVLINAHNFNKPPAQQQRVNVVRVISHPQWSMRQLKYDYLILKLEKKVPESATVKYSPLPKVQDQDPSQANDLCYVVGWGTMNKSGWGSTSILQKGAMRLITNKECLAAGNQRPQFRNIGASHICAKSAYVDTSACKGDSGGPLYCFLSKLDYKMVQVGVVSFGDIPCAQRDVPVAYARVSHALDWIRRYL